MPNKITQWDPAESLDTREEALEFMSLALEKQDLGLFQRVLGIVARSQSMADVAKKAGVGRESLYKSLSAEGNPSWQTVFKVLDALGFKLQIIDTYEQHKQETAS